MKGISSLSNKGQLNNLAPAVIAILVAGVFLILGLVMLQGIRDTDIVSKANSHFFGNESINISSQLSGANLVCATYPGSACTISALVNRSTYTNVPSTNYTLTSSGCHLTNESGPFGAMNLLINYTCTYGDEAWTSGNETVIGLGTFADFWEIIILAVVISVVIGLLLAVFGGRQQR